MQILILAKIIDPKTNGKSRGFALQQLIRQGRC